MEVFDIRRVGLYMPYSICIIYIYGNLRKCDGRFHWIESRHEKRIMGMDDRIPRCHSDSFVFAAGLGTIMIVQIAFISSRFV